MGVSRVIPALRHAELVRVGTIYQLAAIAYRKQTGSYPQSFDDITIGGKQLPDDPLQPGTRLVLGNDGITERVLLHADASRTIEVVSGPAILRAQSMATGSKSYSDARDGNRLFLRPVLGAWDPERFELRRAAASKVTAEFREADVDTDTESTMSGFEGRIGSTTNRARISRCPVMPTHRWVFPS